MKRLIFGAAIFVVVIGTYLGVDAMFTRSVDIPTAAVRSGDFVISQNVTGEIEAKRSHVISAPRIRSLQITWLAPEGSIVGEGDPVIKFDASQQTADLVDNQSGLKIAQATLQRAEQEYTIQEKQLTLELEQSRRNYDEKKHEAPRLAKEAKMELELAELNFEAKLDQIRSDVEKAKLEVQRAEEKVRKAQRELDQLTMTAPIPGMVVYLEIWKGGSMSSVQEGDSPWPGQGLINLPDLSEMMVKATISEVDASKVDSGMAVIVKADAYPDKEYHGMVRSKGTLARRKDHNSKINVFDLEIDIMDKDEGLKPGMSASGRVIVESLDGIISVPLEAVFEREGRTLVYLDNGREKEVEVGRRNDMHIEITDGLTGNEIVCLVDPTLDEPNLPGDRASEPELNKGRTSTGHNGAGEQGH